jgi:predicted transposase/invertase (TIGR01784 family)
LEGKGARVILGIDPKVDFAFKYLFGRESTRSILIDVLNAVLNLPPGHLITEIELLNPYNLQERADDKLSILDIKARDQTGRYFTIEMQMLVEEGYPKRLLFYWAKVYQQQLHEGEDYESLRPTIVISFLNGTLFPQTESHHLCFHLREDQLGFAMTQDIEFHFLELPKFTKSLAQLTTALDIWLYFLKFAETIDTASLPPVLKVPGITRAVEELKMLTEAEIERERYESRRLAQMDENVRMRRAKLMGRIQALQTVLGLPESSDAELRLTSYEDLLRLADELEKKALAGR